MWTDRNRSRGVILHTMPGDEINGPAEQYALLLRTNGDKTQARMVCAEGVGYLVTDEKPWCWTDYDDTQPTFTLRQLLDIAASEESKEVDLADWVRVFGDRLENNFSLHYHWANS